MDDTIVKRTLAASVAAGLLMFAGLAIAETEFSEDFSVGATGCVAGWNVNVYNNWNGPYPSTELGGGVNHALCDASAGEFGVIGNKYLALKSSYGTAGSGWAKHGISPSGAWSIEAEVNIPCNQPWGSVFFSLLEAQGMARVGFADNDLSLDVENGGSTTYDQATLSCPSTWENHFLKLTFGNATASSYSVYLDDSLVGTYSTSSSTTPSYIRFGTETSGDDVAIVGVDNIYAKRNL
jgi:hypothetical protein